MPMRISVYAGFENGPYVIRVNKSERGHAPRYSYCHGGQIVGVISMEGGERFGEERKIGNRWKSRCKLEKFFSPIVRFFFLICILLHKCLNITIIFIIKFVNVDARLFPVFSSFYLFIVKREEERT